MEVQRHQGGRLIGRQIEITLVGTGRVEGFLPPEEVGAALQAGRRAAEARERILDVSGDCGCQRSQRS